ncbi:queuine tRNA-ribosyltransferase [uncultured Legionella sp.]|uniref:queuine tRNA-ribosyltransferase n=1 Tax=uncultured Legionella sp. TaxID=210934 RepID=UPI002630217E|nr:queuine tRNA-ribosyltransferase [uncultured Legionella sp.]
MAGNVQNYVPVLTSEAGSCLTSAEWKEAGVSSVSYYLDSLLIKPGVELLKRIDNLSGYVGWHGTVILNASRLQANRDGIFNLSSPYDGSKIKFNYSELFTIINNLKPDAVLLPKKTMLDAPECLNSLDSSIIPYFAVEDLMKKEYQKQHGVYFNPTDVHAAYEMAEKLQQWSHLPRYVIHSLDSGAAGIFDNLNVEYVESDVPAATGFHGRVYSGKDTIDLTDVQFNMQFNIIDSNCTCPTCTQQFTQAYLHHLYLHTPLLCQRFLIQHNAFQAGNSA